jgi:hypothetical protein
MLKCVKASHVVLYVMGEYQLAPQVGALVEPDAGSVAEAPAAAVDAGQ